MKTKEYNATTKQTTIRDMTPEEIAAMEAQATEQPALTPTIEERVGKVEEDTAIIRAILLGEEESE